MTGMSLGLQPSRVGRLGCVWDVPGTLEWDRQWEYSHLEWDDWDVPEMSLGFLGLWDGMDSEIGTI